MSWFNEEKEEDRTHQDSNSWNTSKYWNHQGREDYQYCRFCDADRPFLYDRCKECKNN